MIKYGSFQAPPGKSLTLWAAAIAEIILALGPTAVVTKMEAETTVSGDIKLTIYVETP